MATQAVVIDGSGVKNDSQKLPYYLLPSDALEEVVRVLGYGAGKYIRRGRCTCVSIAESLEMLIQEASVEVVMKNGCEKTIHNTQTGSGTMPEHGQSVFLKEKDSQTPYTKAGHCSRESVWQENMDSLLINTMKLLQTHAGSAEMQTLRDTLTTIIPRVGSGGLSATLAISELEHLKKEVVRGQSKHWPGCGALNVIQTGERNWEKGMSWSRPFAAMMRHSWAWWRGEDNDPESGLNHMAHAACCALFLLAYCLRKDLSLYDDRERLGLRDPRALQKP